MKIACLLDSIRSYRSTAQYQRIKYLSKHHDIFMFVNKEEKVPDEIKENVKIFLTTRFSKENRLLYVIWRFITIMRLEEDIEAVYTYYQPFSIVEGFIYKLFGFKWIAEVWDNPILIVEENAQKMRWKLLYLLSKSELKFADLIILAIEKESVKDFFLEEKKILSITNGVSPNNYDFELMEKISEPISLFYVGPIKKKLGLISLIRLSKKLKVEGIDFNLNLIGPIENKRSVKNKIKKLKLENNIKLYGKKPHEETLKIMKKSDVCLLPFEKNPYTNCIYPIKLFEYLAMGKPVIASNLDGIKKIINDGKNGFIVDFKDSTNIVRIIEKIISEDERVRQLSENARKTALEYSWDNINKKVNNEIKYM